MERDIIPMSQKERQRFHLLEMAIGGKITLKDAGERMGVSYRWVVGSPLYDYHVYEMSRSEPYIFLYSR